MSNLQTSGPGGRRPWFLRASPGRQAFSLPIQAPAPIGVSVVLLLIFIIFANATLEPFEENRTCEVLGGEWNVLGVASGGSEVSDLIPRGKAGPACPGMLEAKARQD